MSTINRKFGEDNPFVDWIRKHPDFDSSLGYDREDIDVIWHHYLDGKLMLFEIKCKGCDLSFAQRDTFHIINQALSFAFKNMSFINRKYVPYGRPTKIKYYGFHLIQFENTCPNDGWIKIDHQLVTKEKLEEFLRFEWMPS